MSTAGWVVTGLTVALLLITLWLIGRAGGQTAPRPEAGAEAAPAQGRKRHRPAAGA